MPTAKPDDERVARTERSQSDQMVERVPVWDMGTERRGASTHGIIATARQWCDRSPVPCFLALGNDHRVAYANAPFLDGALLGMRVAVGAPFPGNEQMDVATAVASALETVYRTGGVVDEIELPPAPCSADGASRPRVTLTAWPVRRSADEIAGVAVQLHESPVAASEGEAHELAAELQRQMDDTLLLAASREAALVRRAEVAGRAKSEFLATMSHELRTPLTAILGYEELLADGITGPVNDEQRTQLRRIKASAMQLLGLIDQMLTLSRVDAGRTPVRWEVLDACSVVREAMRVAAPLANSRALRLRAEYPTQSVAFTGDASKLQQILASLLDNAARFTDSGEIVITFIGPVPHGGDPDAPHDILFTVRDTGIGIRPEHHEAIFDPFWQVEQTTTRQVGGTGLGLDVSRRLARLLGGDITVESTPGEGSTFIVRLPISHDDGQRGRQGTDVGAERTS